MDEAVRGCKTIGVLVFLRPPWMVMIEEIGGSRGLVKVVDNDFIREVDF